MRMHPPLVSCAHFFGLTKRLWTSSAQALFVSHRPLPGRKGHIMKIKYTFDNGEISEVEVSDEIGTFIMDSRRIEESANKKESRHCYSLDAITYEGAEFGENADYKYIDSDTETRIAEALSHLSAVQKQRLLMLADGLSVREIARREDKNYRSIYDSIEAARKKFLKNF